MNFRSALAKRKWKVVRSRGGGVPLVVGEDLCVDQILDFSGKNLVGKFIGRRIGNMEQLCRSIKEVWNPILEYGPTYHILSRDYLGFIFHSGEDANVILKGSWFLDSELLSLKPWAPLFDHKNDFSGNTPVWVKLSSLLMEFDPR